MAVSSHEDGAVLIVGGYGAVGLGVARRLARGVHYVDVSARYAFLQRVERLDALARERGATARLSVGVAPGLTNLLGAYAAGLLVRVERIDLSLELGLGDRHGRAAMTWMLDEMGVAFDLTTKEGHAARSFGERIDIALPGGPARAASRRARRGGGRAHGRTVTAGLIGRDDVHGGVRGGTAAVVGRPSAWGAARRAGAPSRGDRRGVA